jgi:hypothetical protein
MERKPGGHQRRRLLTVKLSTINRVVSGKNGERDPWAKKEQRRSQSESSKFELPPSLKSAIEKQLQEHWEEVLAGKRPACSYIQSVALEKKEKNDPAGRQLTANDEYRSLLSEVELKFVGHFDITKVEWHDAHLEIHPPSSVVVEIEGEQRAIGIDGATHINGTVTVTSNKGRVTKKVFSRFIGKTFWQHVAK